MVTLIVILTVVAKMKDCYNARILEAVYCGSLAGSTYRFPTRAEDISVIGFNSIIDFSWRVGLPVSVQLIA